jgi:signal transduction histidine kinase
MPEKNVDMLNDIPPDIPFVEADENRLQQILYNLIGNAFKFTQNGYVRIGAAESGDSVEIWVEDTGIGIPSDRQDDIFKSFEQVDGSISREFGGTGLGLSITKKLVELHAGGYASNQRSEGIPVSASA